MICKDKGILDSTMLKIVAKLLKDNPSGVKGFKVKTLNGKVNVTYDEAIRFVESLAEEFNKGNYAKLNMCETCGNYAHPGRRGSPGWCSPSNFTSTRRNKDYCSGWTPMSETQAYTRRSIRHEWSLQTKRVGDDAENSNKGN